MNTRWSWVAPAAVTAFGITWTVLVGTQALPDHGALIVLGLGSIAFGSAMAGAFALYVLAARAADPAKVERRLAISLWAFVLVVIVGPSGDFGSPLVAEVAGAAMAGFLAGAIVARVRQLRGSPDGGGAGDHGRAGPEPPWAWLANSSYAWANRWAGVVVAAVFVTVFLSEHAVALVRRGDAIGVTIVTLAASAAGAGLITALLGWGAYRLGVEKAASRGWRVTLLSVIGVVVGLASPGRCRGLRCPATGTAC